MISKIPLTNFKGDEWVKMISDTFFRSREKFLDRFTKGFVLLSFILGVMVTLNGCTLSTRTPTPTQPSLAAEITFYDWDNDIPQSVFEQFADEYGVKVNVLSYDSQEQIFGEISRGKIYDVVVIENDFLPHFINNGLLKKIDYANVPNFKNIMANFRDLSYDPKNIHSIPFNWSTTGLLVRPDLLEETPDQWSDLWDPQYRGMIGIRKDVSADFIGITLKSLGYSINSENKEELAQAEARMMEIRPYIHLVGSGMEDVIPLLGDGTLAIVVGWSGEVMANQESHPNIQYIIPEDGSLLWGDNFVIPTSSPNQYTAEVFLNFLLRPEIAAEIANYNCYATANEAALPLIDKEILNSPLSFPPDEILQKSEVFTPLSSECTALREDIWERFITGE